MPGQAEKPVLALSGGVGGAKLALGLAEELAPGQLHVMVNTGDDFHHLGLHISPDIDTLLYTLSGRANVAQGWGLEGESWNALAALGALGGETWFRLGDQDLATHLWRTWQLAQGDSLSAVTADLARRMDIDSHIYPMTDDPVSTTVHCDGYDLAFQRYFVEQQCEPAVTGFSFRGIDQATASSSVLSLLQEGNLSAIVVCPSNPFVSVDPILQLPGFAAALGGSSARVILVSPIVGGMAIKGPAAKMMRELGMPVTAEGVARHYVERYPGLVDDFVIDESDATLAGQIRELGLEVSVTPTVMKTLEDKQRLARFVLGQAGP